MSVEQYGPIDYVRIKEALAEKLREELTKPFTWLIESMDYSPESAVAGYTPWTEASPLVGDPMNVVYDENGDLIVANNGNGPARGGVFPSSVVKVRRPKSGVVGGTIEWVQTVDGQGSAPMNVYYNKYLKQAILLYGSKIYILDPGGNIVRTITPAFTWDATRYVANTGPEAVFFNDKQILLCDVKAGALYIMNLDGSVAWSATGFSTPVAVWTYFAKEYVIRYIHVLEYGAQRISNFSWSAKDQYTLPPSSPSIGTLGYFPYPRSITEFRGGKYLLLDCEDSNMAFGYIHWFFDTPEFSIPLANSNSIDAHPYLPRVVLTHKNSIFEIDINEALTNNPFTNGFTNLYVGQPSTSESTLAWTYTKRLSKVIFHIYNAMNVDATVKLYFMYPYDTTKQIFSTSYLNTLTPPPTPAVSETVASGTSKDIPLSAAPIAVMVRGLSATTPTSGNLIVSAYGEA